MSDPIAVPVVETERLLLRGRRLADFDAIAAMWGDPRVTRFIGGKPRPEEECWTKFLRDAGLWAHLGFGYWVVEEKATGAVVGEIGFADYKREMTPSIKGFPEFGYSLVPAVHGKGYASEAGKAAVAWGDQNFSAPHMVCIITPENAPSIRVAEKCGFEITGAAIYHGDKIVVLHRPIASRS
ncbi:GNAT family N-acetyltransferase [Hyphococcus sp.]|jgi:RimJ/RimL family protein N-acetyltransferase|uniref:GNAT family N-acetyltransferase n=1 Tax=Hyphococcus sp. TaxID=2038636 RepID=UPI003D0DB68A